MDTEKQRQCRRDDTRLTESGNARSEQLNTRGAYRVANQQRLACLSGSKRQRPGWFLDMKYQTCYSALFFLMGIVIQLILHAFIIIRCIALANVNQREALGGTKSYCSNTSTSTDHTRSYKAATAHSEVIFPRWLYRVRNWISDAYYNRTPKLCFCGSNLRSTTTG